MSTQGSGDGVATDAELPTPARAGSAGTRTRFALVLLALTIVLPMTANLITPRVLLDAPLVLFGALAAGAALLALGTAIVAPAGAGPRAAVIALAVASGAGGLWLMAFDTRTPLGVVSLALAVIGPLEVPALAWLGAALAAGLADRVERSWRTALRLNLAVAGAQMVLSAVVIGTYGAALRLPGGFDAYVLLGTALSAAATVGMLHVLVSVVRSWRDLDGHPPPTLRPWLLASVLVAAVAVAIVTTLRSGVL